MPTDGPPHPDTRYRSHEGLEAQNRDAHPSFEAWLRGMIAYLRMVNPEQGKKLWRELEALG